MQTFPLLSAGKFILVKLDLLSITQAIINKIIPKMIPTIAQQTSVILRFYSKLIIIYEK
jgi:hypothetical protein